MTMTLGRAVFRQSAFDDVEVGLFDLDFELSVAQPAPSGNRREWLNKAYLMSTWSSRTLNFLAAG